MSDKVNAAAIQQLLNIVLCADKARSIDQAKKYLMDEGYLGEDGEPTARAWKLPGSVKT